MRSVARECVFKSIFAEFFYQQDEELFAVLLKNEKLTEDDKVFAKNLYENLNKNKEEYLKNIEDISVSFRTDRIFVADKCAILVGITELNTYKDTPIPVVVDEAVKLAVTYSTERSSDFVNGILAEYIRRNTNG